MKNKKSSQEIFDIIVEDILAVKIKANRALKSEFYGEINKLVRELYLLLIKISGNIHEIDVAWVMENPQFWFLKNDLKEIKELIYKLTSSITQKNARKPLKGGVYLDTVKSHDTFEESWVINWAFNEKVYHVNHQIEEMLKSQLTNEKEFLKPAGKPKIAGFDFKDYKQMAERVANYYGISLVHAMLLPESKVLDMYEILEAPQSGM